MNFLIFVALCLIAYNIWFNTGRVSKIRRAENERQSQLDSNWETFSRALDQINKRKMEFFAGLANMTEAQRKELWQPVLDKTAAACRFFLNHDLARGLAHLNLANSEADQIIGNGKAA